MVTEITLQESLIIINHATSYARSIYSSVGA